MNYVIMNDADCTPGREPRCVAASYKKIVRPDKYARKMLWGVENGES